MVSIRWRTTLGGGAWQALEVGVKVYIPPPCTGPFRGAELGPSTSPHSLEAPGSVHGGSAQGHKLGPGTPRQPGKDSPGRPGQHPLWSVPWAEANLNHGELTKERESLGGTMEFSCPIYQGVRKFFLRSDQTVTSASFLHQLLLQLRALRVPCAYPLRGTQPRSPQTCGQWAWAPADPSP